MNYKKKSNSDVQILEILYVIARITNTIASNVQQHCILLLRSL